MNVNLSQDSFLEERHEIAEQPDISKKWSTSSRNFHKALALKGISRRKQKRTEGWAFILHASST